MKKVFLLFLLISSLLAAQSNVELFANANTLYKEGKYQEAIAIYEGLENNNLVSSELYYNLGNCYYKLNKVAPTIYNYEKALLLNPTNEDARNNLIFAKRLSFDRIEEVPKTFLQKINTKYISRLTFENWAIVCIILSILGTILFILYFLSYAPIRKRLFFTTSLLCYIILVLSLSITYHQYYKKINTIEAIIYVAEVSVKNEPTKNSDESFILHEGTKVRVLDTVDDWKKIQLVDGKIGWLKADEVNLLNIF